MASRAEYGALGVMFSVMRILQTIVLITMIGLTSNFISEMVAASYQTPSALIGTLVIACMVAVYTIMTYMLYWDCLLPLLVSTAADGLCLVAVIVVAVAVGKPVSYLTCTALAERGNTANFIASLFRNLSRSNTYEWIDADQASCLEMKAVWGLSICLCVLFLFSGVTSMCLWRRIKGSASQQAVKQVV
ncbi:hypothetical protein CDD82_5325 [Ophiocordyceps australis]|uniref:MARVEL domain-containing protein n=1 Tax=Ophiocordyceps australis TaxID=1399860 RepID=A0A2C5Z112_9HYPO|nr:hypothetical protein CDD82_5325 [Ophiocordyceps australis]